jgi:benzoylformate decarboxylase
MGRLSRKQADWERRVRFAEAIGAAVLTSSNDAAAFPTTHALHFAPPCVRPNKSATALIEKADLIISLDWLDLAGILRLALSDAQTQKPTDKTVIHCSVDNYRTNGWSMDHQALAAIDIPILAEPDQLVAQLLEEMAVKRDGKDQAPAGNEATWPLESAVFGRRYRKKRYADDPMGHGYDGAGFC